MVTTNSKFTEDQIELLDRLLYRNKPLTPEELYSTGYDAVLLLQKYRDDIQPQLPYLGGYKELLHLREKGVETEEQWERAMIRSSSRHVKCLRVTKPHGISMFRGGRPYFGIL